MNGVDILAMEEVVAESAFNWPWFWIVVAVAGFITLIYTLWDVVSGYHHWLYIPTLTVFVMLVGAMFGCLLGVVFGIPTKYETQYKVTISDEVSMTDFLNKYEIIETEGKIYTVREKGADAK